MIRLFALTYSRVGMRIAGATGSILWPARRPCRYGPRPTCCR